jgi:hypothetical protein
LRKHYFLSDMDLLVLCIWSLCVGGGLGVFITLSCHFLGS